MKKKTNYTVKLVSFNSYRFPIFDSIFFFKGKNYHRVCVHLQHRNYTSPYKMVKEPSNNFLKKAK